MYKMDNHSEFKEKTGYDCALHLIEMCRQQKRQLPHCLVHSMNPVGKQRIIELLHSARLEFLEGNL